MSPTLIRAVCNGDERWLVKAFLADLAAPDVKTAATAEGKMLLHLVAVDDHVSLVVLLRHVQHHAQHSTRPSHPHPLGAPSTLFLSTKMQISSLFLPIKMEISSLSSESLASD